MAPAWKEELKVEIMGLPRGVNSHSQSPPWTAPVVPVENLNGSIRLCKDFRSLKSVTEPGLYIIPRVEEMLW